MHATDNQGTHHYTRDVHLPSPTQEPAIKPLIPSSQYVTTDDHEANGTHQGSPETDPLTITPGPQVVVSA